MFKSYVVSIIGFLLGVGALLYAGFYTKLYDSDNLRQEYSFNAASIEHKLIGKSLEEISDRYLAPVLVKKQKGKGNMEARFENIRIFTRGDSTIVRGIDVVFKDGAAAEITYDEPVKDKDAAFANASPLSFFFMDKELFTKGMNVIRPQQAENWQIPLLLLLLLGLGGIPFLLTWPLTTLLAKKMGGATAAFLSLVIWLALYWLYLGIVAYTLGSAMLFLILGGVWVVMGLIAFGRTASRQVSPASTPDYDSSYDSSYGDDLGSDPGPTPPQKQPRKPKVDAAAVEHLQNLAMMLSVSFHDKLPVENRMEVISNISTREGVDIESFKYAMANPTGEIPKRVSGQRKMQFIDDLAESLACEGTVSNTLVGMTLMIAEKYGLDTAQFFGRVNNVAKRKYQRSFPDDYQINEVS